MKYSLFEENNEKVDDLTITEAANRANVSSATIRNWVKTGYLQQNQRGLIELGSLNQFMETIAGKEKLVQRANKLFKDHHDHDTLSKFIQKNIDGDNWSKISEDYEVSLSSAYRNKEGIYYTPNKVIDDMLSEILIEDHTTFLDPCCGSGNFIIQSIRKGIKPKNAYGFDIDINAVEITKKRILEETGYDASNNIKHLNFLEDAIELSKEQKYDLIFTNPPWGKKIKKIEKERYASIYQAGTSLDTTSLFYFASFLLLKHNGIIGFLVQDALFNITAFQDTRKHILQQNLLRLIDYGKAFKGLLTKAQAFILKNNNFSNSKVQCDTKDDTHYRAQNTFISNPKYILNFWSKKEECEVIKRVYELPYVTLQNKATWGMGIVTGNNAKYCIKESRDGFVPVFKGSDIMIDGLKEPSTYIPDNFSKYQQVAPLNLYQSKSKLLYKFISSRLVFFNDIKQRFILNSANFMIPHQSLGVSNQQLADLLSSDFINWLFIKIFNTHKILRGDLELLPIHIQYFTQYNHFSDVSYLNYIGITRDGDKTYRIKN